MTTVKVPRRVLGAVAAAVLVAGVVIAAGLLRVKAFTDSRERADCAIIDFMERQHGPVPEFDAFREARNCEAYQ